MITYSQNLDNPELCYVSAIIRILAYTQRLAVNHDASIAVARVKKKMKKIAPFLTSTLVTLHSQNATKVVHDIRSDKNLVQFSTHYLRVGACVLLHINGKPLDHIKLRLRWRSDSYKYDLRDVTMLTVAHADVIHKAVTTLKKS